MNKSLQLEIPAGETNNNKEKMIWSGSPSQYLNVPYFVGYGIISITLIPLFFILWEYLVVKNIKYQMTNERLRKSHGVINKYVDELELYRVRDFRFEQPFFLRIFGLGNLVMETSDRTHPVMTIRAIADGNKLMHLLRTHVEQCRMRRGVREFDVQ